MLCPQLSIAYRPARCRTGGRPCLRSHLTHKLHFRLRNTDVSGRATRESFYQGTTDAHAYIADKMPYLRKTLDKKEAGTVITEFEYELDKAGVRLSMTDKDDKYYSYAYDPRYQVRSETKWSQKTGETRSYQYGWAYDGNGNKIYEHDDGVEDKYTYGTNNQMTDAGAEDFIYDHFGNTKTKTEDERVTTYSWDDERHMTSVVYPDEGTDDAHEYDGDGRRMRSKLNGATDWTNFIQDELSLDLLMEYTLINGSYTIKPENTWGLGLISTNRAGTKRYYHFDGLGSTRVLTDSSEATTDTYEYSVFGTLESSTGTSTNPYRFVGQFGYYDDGARGSAHGLLLLGVRYYSPDYGRFWSWDPVPMVNLYGYVGNAATMAIDPMGWFGTIPGYECCGPQNKPCEFENAINDLDRCCCLHDECWKRAGCTAWNQCLYCVCVECNLQLCACALRARCGLFDFYCQTVQRLVLAYACTACPFTMLMCAIETLLDAPNSDSGFGGGGRSGGGFGGGGGGAW